MAATAYTLPALPYAYDALEPHISASIMTLHHTKHHQAYITNLNNALSTLTSASLATKLHLQAVVAFNAGGHLNHSLFWSNLSPASSPSSNPVSAPSTQAAISSRWGDLTTFQSQFNALLTTIRGSGWGWLVQDTATGALEILSTRDQEIVPKGKKALLGIDMWEHAYYLQYLNDRAAYVKGVWQIVNWEVVEKRFLGKESEVWEGLEGLKAGL